MVFSSIIFLLYFFPVFLVLYFVAPDKWKNHVALAGSSVFYLWGAPVFFFLLMAGLAIDFYLNRLIWYADGKVKNRLLLLVIVLNTATLLICKYLDFFTENLNLALSVFSFAQIPLPHILLPVGISFITFQKLSYTLDIFRGKAPVQENFVNYALYILLFPQLIAGPIVRYNEVATQLSDRKLTEHIDYKLAGFFRFVIGLGKKVLIANALGEFADPLFALPPEQISTAMAWLGIVSYSFQIYFDFAGYSDMAIGIALMMGFRFAENFHFPYISQTITEFWRRWHISLGNWMRDYLYIPLGGNRKGESRTYLNLWIVFLISGFWHGASWNFVVWGAFHGFFLIADRLFLQKWLHFLGRIPSVMITYVTVLIGWVFFRADTLSYAFGFLGRMFSFENFHMELFADSRTLTILLFAAVFSFMGLFPKVEQLPERIYSGTVTLPVVIFRAVMASCIGLFCLTELFARDFNPFIYFRF